MRVLFVDNLLFEGDALRPAFDLQPHLGLLSLAAVARRAGHDADIFDLKLALVRGELSWSEHLYEDAAQRILDHAPDVVGFTALGCNFHCVVQIAMAINRQQPAIPLLLGGPHASILHREILERLPCFAVIARHEAEETIIPLLESLGSEAAESVPGISWRRGDGQVVCNPGKPTIEQLDDLPLPAFDRYPISEANLSSIRVEAGRGCPFSCTFCSTASFFGRSYRLKSSARLVAEMDLLADEYGFADFKLNHDLFTVNRRKVLDFCEAVAPRGYHWACSARADCVDTELLEAMAAAGCRSIYFGIETGSTAMQEVSRKRLDLALVEPVLVTTVRLGITTTTSFIIGYPEETAADRAATLDMVGRLHLLKGNTSQIHLLTPEPGTALLEQHRSSLRFDGRRCGFNLPRFIPDDDVLISTVPDLFLTHYHYQGLVPHDRNVLAAAFWQQLSTVGDAGFAFLLDHWNRRLSSLLDAAYDWWPGAGRPDAVPSPDALVHFAQAIFGREAPIVSLLRYAVACRAEPARCRGLPAARREGSGRPRLAEKATLLRDIHDVSRAGASVLFERDGRRTNLVVMRSDGNAPACAFEVDGTTADLLGVIGHPGADAILAKVDAADLEQLRVLQIIETEPFESVP